MKTYIRSIELGKISNPGCNNGNYAQGIVTTVDGDIFKDWFCRCWNGCGGTLKVWQDKKGQYVYREEE